VGAAAGLVAAVAAGEQGVDRLEATEIRTFQPLYVPGLLQTENYMRATAYKGQASEELIAKRLARRDILARETGQPHLFVVLDQAAILRRWRDTSIMQEQLRYLLDIGEAPEIHIQTVQITTGWHPGLDGAMVVLTKADRSRIGTSRPNSVED
jgi:hypothetical protein